MKLTAYDNESRYGVYCSTPKMAKYFEKRNWIIRDKECEEYLSQQFEITDEISEERQRRFTLYIGSKAEPQEVYLFNYAQMDGNCNALIVCRMMTLPPNLPIAPRMLMFLVKNVMSYLGDNVALVSDKEKKFATFEEYGLTPMLTANSIRGYSSHITYGFIHLKDSEMATRVFSILNNKGTLADPLLV